MYNVIIQWILKPTDHVTIPWLLKPIGTNDVMHRKFLREKSSYPFNILKKNILAER